MIRRPASVLLLTLAAIATLAGSASAGGRTTSPSPAWLGDVIVVGLSLMGIAYLVVVAIGAVQRRQR
jgi:hypothetical protein